MPEDIAAQLPYIDRVLYEVKSPDILGISVANGEVSAGVAVSLDERIDRFSEAIRELIRR